MSVRECLPRARSHRSCCEDEFGSFCQENKEAINAGIESYQGGGALTPFIDGIKKLVSLSGPSEFKDKINAYFQSKGMFQHKVTDVWPATISGQWTYMDFTESCSKNNMTYDEGYYLVVSYKGRQIIGPLSNNTFSYVCVKDEGDRIRLIHSSRCQHVSAWSSGKATDQQYDHWDIADWITGPMAEEAKIDVEEFPAVFMGNRLTETTKKKALDQLRARINAIR